MPAGAEQEIRMAAHPSALASEELPPVPINRQSLREALSLLRYLLPYWPRFLAAHAALLVSSLAGLAFPYAAGQLVNGALNRDTGDLGSSLLTHVDTIALVLLGLLAVQAALNYVETLWLAQVGRRSLADLRRDTYSRLIRLPMAFHTRRRVGELGSRVAADLAEIQDTLVSEIPHFVGQTIMLVGGLTLLFFTSPHLTLLLLVSFPPVLVVAVLFGRAIRKLSSRAQDHLAESHVIVEETLQGIASVKAFTNETHEEQRYQASLERFLEVILRVARYRGAFHAFVIFALFGSILLVLWYGARLVLAGGLTAGDLTSFMLYTLFVGGAMGSFASLYSQIQRTLGATSRVREILTEEPEFSINQPHATQAQPIRGEVAFTEVSFRYPSRKDVEVLHQVSFRIDPDERVALVGPSGAGKSTVASLLLRFHDPDQGQVLIDGRDARDYPLPGLRGKMAVVPQDVLLFGGTIFDNIAYGKPGASAEEVEEAARQANAHDFIGAFPDGYQTRVGERGVQLSGGQRQRVAIARALLRNPTVLILDEATSSLDSESEHLVLQALDRLMQGRTCLIITHRLSTVRRADRILVLQEGRIVEQGTHAELLQQQGIYHGLLELFEQDGQRSNGLASASLPDLTCAPPAGDPERTPSAG
jgi:ABC transporter fused permease/ATP-binding protein